MRTRIARRLEGAPAMYETLNHVVRGGVERDLEQFRVSSSDSDCVRVIYDEAHMNLAAAV